MCRGGGGGPARLVGVLAEGGGVVEGVCGCLLLRSR